MKAFKCDGCSVVYEGAPPIQAELGPERDHVRVSDTVTILP